MIWKSEGGGPWGTGPRGGGRGPWGGGNGSGDGGGPGAPRGRGPTPPNIEEILRRSQDRLRGMFPGGGFRAGAGIAVAIIAVVVLWLASGFYRVLPDEVGVVLRFGAYNRTTQPGLNYHMPTPIESVETPSVTRQNRLEVGYRSSEGSSSHGRQVPEEALMLTGDENIVDINFTVLWVVKDAKSYLFNIRNPEGTVKSAAESAMREIVGETPIASALAEGRGKIETETEKLLQQILDSYGSGIEITLVQLQKVDPPDPVIESFRDVQRALADRARLKNEAESYRNDILPKARGSAVQVRQEAEAYKASAVARATGDAARFDDVYKAYKVARDVTAQRLYIETMEEILKNSNKVILDRAAEGGGGVVPYLPLPSLPGFGNVHPPAAAPAPPAPAAPTAGRR
ncbi:MAG TPA: FtsH protease activity modulator HflK [Stellaceae bacterium]|jgi:membrane protease subunit HflK